MPSPRLPRPALASLLALLLAVSWAAPGAADDGPDVRATDPPAPTRVLLLGDSVTHGSAGDWTWRYRLWKHLAADDVPVDFVGPDRSLADSDAYADRRFDRDHAALWGLWAAGGMERVSALVADHRPDVLSVMLGINDLLYDAPAESVVWCLEQIVLLAREVDPTLDVVLSEVTQTWFTPDGRAAAVNAELPRLAARLTTSTSRVEVAHTAVGYRVGHTYDTSHPSAQGEVRIAAAVADSLARLGVGRPYPRPLRSVGNVPRQPVDLRAEPRRRSVRLTWTVPPGATSFVLWQRDLTARQQWHKVGIVEGTRLRVGGLRPRHRYEFRMRARKGTVTVTDLSAQAGARPRR